MMPLSHISYPALFFVLLAEIFHINYSILDIGILIFFSILPDFDFFLFSFFKEGDKKIPLSRIFITILASITPGFIIHSEEIISIQKRKKSYHHRFWPTHWPLAYFPLILLFFLYPSLKISLALLGIYSHFIMDSFLRGKVMWFYPFSKKKFGFFEGKFKDIEGFEYFHFYKKSIFHKMEIAAFILLSFFVFKKFFLHL